MGPHSTAPPPPPPEKATYASFKNKNVKHERGNEEVAQRCGGFIIVIATEHWPHLAPGLRGLLLLDESPAHTGDPAGRVFCFFGENPQASLRRPQHLSSGLACSAAL